MLYLYSSFTSKMPRSSRKGKGKKVSSVDDSLADMQSSDASQKSDKSSINRRKRGGPSHDHSSAKQRRLSNSSSFANVKTSEITQEKDSSCNVASCSSSSVAGSSKDDMQCEIVRKLHYMQLALLISKAKQNW